MTAKRFTITKGFDEHERQIRDNGKIIMGCFIQPQAEPIVKLLNEQHEVIDICENRIAELRKENKHLKATIKEAYNNERTMMGKSVLKQLMETIQ